ncbi:MAG TPA: tetratricopeptide repeat protein [Thermoanaerobaculia bacterium]
MTTRTFEDARHLISLGRPAEALDKLKQSFDSEDPLFWWLRGVALFALDRPGEALDAARNGLRVEPESPLLLDLVARCHSSRGELAEAEEAVLAALRTNAEDAELLALYALIVAKAGQVEKAKKLVAQARRVDPENTSAIRVEAAIAVSRGDDREALLRGREMLALDPEDTHAHLLTGGVLHDRGDIDDAAEYLRTAVVNDPADPVAAESARENLLWRHPLMWPLRPAQKFGSAKVWLAGILLLFAARSTKNTPIMLTVGIAWLVYVLYSWVVPPLVRRMLR